MRVGFIGTGLMGGPMAMHLVRAGLDVMVYNRTREKTEPHAEAGADVCGTVAELAAECGIVFLCVSDTPDVAGLVRSPGGLAAGMREGSLLVDHSTISPTVTRELADELAERGVALVDAPVSGGTSGAQEGTLVVMAGGETGAVERARPLMEHYAGRIVHVGPVGQGQLMKCCNQLVAALHVLALAEGFRFAETAGLDRALAHEVVGGGAAGSFIWRKWGAALRDGDLSPGFRIRLHRKDLGLVRAECERMGLSLPGLELVVEVYDRAMELGLGEKGDQALGGAL